MNIIFCQYSFSLPYSFGFEKEYWLRWFNERCILDSLNSNPAFIKHYKIKSITTERIDYDSPFQHAFVTNEYNPQGLITKKSADNLFYTEENGKKVTTILYYEKGKLSSSVKEVYGNCGIELYIYLDGEKDNNFSIQKCYYDNCELIAVTSDKQIAEYKYLDSCTVMEIIHNIREPLKKKVYISQFNALHQKVVDIEMEDNLKDTINIFLYEYDEKNRLVLARELRQSLRNRKKEFGVQRLELEYENEKLSSLAFFEWGEENYPKRYCLSYQGNLLSQIDIYSVFAKKRTYRLRYEFYE